MTPPRIIDPTLRSLPLMNSIKDAVNLDLQQGTNFHVSAYLFQCWICKVNLCCVAQLAEKPASKDWSFQTGEASRVFRFLFGKASNNEFPIIFGHLMEFAACDDPIAAQFFRAIVPLTIEHNLTGRFLGPRTPADFRSKPRQLLALMRRTVTRICDWVDSASHYRALAEWHVQPGALDPDPQKRELTYLGINQRFFDHLDTKSQAHWLNHMSDAVDELKNSPKWSAFRQAASGPLPAPRPWPTQELDAAVIRLWPLANLHNWSGADLLFVLRRLLPPAELAPVSDEKALAAYCANNLGLRRPGLSSCRHRGSEPRALNVALRICTKDPAPSESLTA